MPALPAATALHSSLKETMRVLVRAYGKHRCWSIQHAAGMGAAAGGAPVLHWEVRGEVVGSGTSYRENEYALFVQRIVLAWVNSHSGRRVMLVEEQVDTAALTRLSGPVCASSPLTRPRMRCTLK